MSSPGQRELLLYIENNEQLYRQQGLPIIKNLTRKKASGVYDHEKAVKLYKYLADNGARSYGKEFGSSEHDGLTMFSPSERKMVAQQLTTNFEIEYATGAYKEYVPKKYRPRGVARMESQP